ncbi:MAG: hypothetical protein JSV16_00720 [Candidatus Hydrogenedentota bacterium]|nr:MAG: hypothetical protein JSV16_00720 [Candidatus Hydrogenedentota bacterium]
MNKFIITLVIIWLAWKVIKSAIEELQQRMEDRMAGDKERREPAVDRTSRSRTVPRQAVPTSSRAPASRAPASRETEDWEIGQPMPGDEESELERWFQQALDRKRQMDDAAGRTPQQVRKRIPPEPRRRPRVERAQVVHPRRTSRRVEPRTERHREIRVEQKQVARPKEPAAAKPARESREALPEVPEPRRHKKTPKRRAREELGLAELVGASEWDMDDIRRGIIIAEILGPPKALGDIDSHVI